MSSARASAWATTASSSAPALASMSAASAISLRLIRRHPPRPPWRAPTLRSPVPVIQSAEEKVFPTEAATCSTICPSSDIRLKLVNTLNECYLSAKVQQRYITSYSPACSFVVWLSTLATQVHAAQSMLDRMVGLNPVVIDLLLSILVYKEPGPVILDVERFCIPPKPPWSLVCLQFDTMQLYSIPWPSFTGHTVVVDSLSSTWSTVELLFGDVVELPLEFSCSESKCTHLCLQFEK